MYDHITNQFNSNLSLMARRIYAALFDLTNKPAFTSYVAAWTLQDALGEEIGLCGVPGPGVAAMKELIDAGLVRELPDLGCRFELTTVAWRAHLDRATRRMQMVEGQLDEWKAMYHRHVEGYKEFTV